MSEFAGTVLSGIQIYAEVTETVTESYFTGQQNPTIET